MHDVNLLEKNLRSILSDAKDEAQPRRQRIRRGVASLVCLLLIIVGVVVAWRASSHAPVIDDAQVRRLYAYICLAASTERVSVVKVRDELQRVMGGGSLELIAPVDLEHAITWLDRRIRSGIVKEKFLSSAEEGDRQRCVA